VIIPGAGPKGRDLRRAYSIASSPEVRPIELCVKIVDGGPGTQFLYKLRPGDTFKALAPYGAFTYNANKARHACFVATGTGIAPFRSMVMSNAFREHPPLSAQVLLGVRTEDELMYLDNAGGFAQVQYIKAVSQPTPTWNGFKGRVTDYLRSLGESYPWKDTDFYLCGNGDMIQEVKNILAERGVEKTAIHQEKYY
jgi:CDP-4-dehydro-6-deoxyglucose reductase, E3